MLTVTPFETTQRHLRTVSDWASYKKIHSTLPAAVLAALKARVRAGSVNDVRELWDKKDKTFLALDFQWSERNKSSCLEWGYAAMRCGDLSSCVDLLFFCCVLCVLRSLSALGIGLHSRTQTTGLFLGKPNRSRIFLMRAQERTLHRIRIHRQGGQQALSQLPLAGNTSLPHLYHAQ